MTNSQVIDFSRIRATCSDCNLHELCLPRGLEKQDLLLLEQVVRRTRPLHNGDYLFRTGDQFEYIYALKSGSVKLVFNDSEGNDQIIGFYFPGEILGLDAIDKKEHICTAQALETSSYCAFPFSRLTEFCQHIPALQNQMFRLMSRELTTDHELLLTINMKNADVRLATFLVTLSSRFQRLGYSATAFRLSMTRKEIANYLGLTVETVSRNLSRFQQDGLISVNRKLLEINDLDALRHFSSGCRDSARVVNRDF